MATTRLEIACFDAESALTAAEAGADRIELCDEQPVGGTTPPLDWIYQLRPRIKIPIFVMIRPRGGDFHYSDEEFATMRDAIHAFLPYADGFVFGILHSNRSIDVERTRELVQYAAPKPCTFHRAFDEAPDALAALAQVITTGCQAVLTSGGAADAPTGANTLRDIVHQAGDRITVIPGGGVRASNLGLLKRVTQATSFHSSALVHDMTRGDDERLQRQRPNANEIQLMLSILRDSHLIDSP